METLQGYYGITVKHSKYVAGVIGINNIINPLVQLFTDDSMCQSLEPLPPSGLFTKKNITKFFGISGGVYIIRRASKSMASEINKRYFRASHWFKIHDLSSNHPELYILVELHTLISPFIYFHFLFKFSWSIIRSYHKQAMHSKTTNYKISKWRTLLKISGILIGSSLYWIGFTEWSRKQICGRNMSFHSWSCKQALKSIDIEEIRWRKKVSEILYDRFEHIHELSNIVISFVGNSEVFIIQQNELQTSYNLSDYNYADNRRAALRRKYTSKFRDYKTLISCLILSIQSWSYLLLIYKAIKCEHNVCDTYYDKLDEWHNQFEDEYNHQYKEWRIQKWMKQMIKTSWKYLFVDHRLPFSTYIVLGVEKYAHYVSNIYNMNRNTKRYWRNITFCGSMFTIWSWINYVIIEEMTHQTIYWA